MYFGVEGQGQRSAKAQHFECMQLLCLYIAACGCILNLRPMSIFYIQREELKHALVLHLTNYVYDVHFNREFTLS